jgi:sulfide-dependent adenosine diphosphate thiazole synthase
MINENIITRAIIEHYSEKLLSCLELDMVICSTVSSGFVAANYLTRKGLKVAIFEKTFHQRRCDVY